MLAQHSCTPAIQGNQQPGLASSYVQLQLQRWLAVQQSSSTEIEPSFQRLRERWAQLTGRCVLARRSCTPATQGSPRFVPGPQPGPPETMRPGQRRLKSNQKVELSIQTTKDFLNFNVGKHFEMKMRSYNLGEHADAYWLHSAPNPPCVRSRPAGPEL